MNVAEFVHESVTGLNSTIIDDVKPLTQPQAEWQPAPNANPIGFILWHFMRIQDNMVHGFQGKPQVWEAEKWYEKLGVDVKASGVGFQEPEVKNVAALPLADIVAYAERVSQCSSDYFGSLKDADLDRALDPDRPRRTVAATVRAFLIAHGWWHDGEIKYIKGMQGMPFAY